MFKKCRGRDCLDRLYDSYTYPSLHLTSIELFLRHVFMILNPYLSENHSTSLSHRDLHWKNASETFGPQTKLLIYLPVFFPYEQSGCIYIEKLRITIRHCFESRTK